MMNFFGFSPREAVDRNYYVTIYNTIIGKCAWGLNSRVVVELIAYPANTKGAIGLFCTVRRRQRAGMRHDADAIALRRRISRYLHWRQVRE